MTKPTLKSLSAELEELRAQLAAVTKKLAEVGAAESAAAAAEEPEPASTEMHEEDIAPEIVLAISAAVAAYLGERAHVRQIRLLSSRSWSQQGRVSIQASHRLH